MQRRTCLLTLLGAALLGCERSRPATVSEAPGPLAPRAPYGALRTRIAQIRQELAERWRGGDATALAEARQTLPSLLTEVLLPAWHGTKWAFHGTADEPLGPSGIACGYFVVTTLQHLGLPIDSRRRFAQSTARTIARSLQPAPSQHHRVFSVPAQTLERTVRAYGQGVYLLGLDVHVGFLVVRPDAVRVVHASYLGSRTVVDEPLTACAAIDHSRDAGYHVTGLFGDDHLARAWLSQEPISLVGS